jgi:hypothetical protein
MLTKHARDEQEPVTDARLASLLGAAAAPTEPGPVPGEAAALAVFRASSVRADGWRSRMHTSMSPLKSLGVAAVSAGLLLTGGFAAAAAGALPGAAQDGVQDMLAEIGVEVPGANEHSAGHADTRGRSGEAPAGGEAGAADFESESANHGQMISDLARNSDLEGVDKGKAISDAASSNGQAHRHESAPAPEQSAAGAGPGDAGQSGGQARVETPNGGGTGTAGTASAQDDGTSPSTNGTGTAGEMSAGRSTLGSGNADADRPTHP